MPCLPLLAHLRHAKHEVVVFHVLDEQTEQRFDFADRPTTFIDLESGEEVRANPAEVREPMSSKMAQVAARPRCKVRFCRD